VKNSFSRLTLVQDSNILHNKSCRKKKKYRIGYDVIKSTPTYSYVSRNQNNFNTIGISITFKMFHLNIGNASMNSTSEIFTAPRTGTYFFSIPIITSRLPTARCSGFPAVIFNMKMEEIPRSQRK
jgi:hypothetical protein